VEKRKSMGDHCLVHIHEIGYDLPEECLMAMTDELPINLQFLYSCYVDANEFLKLDATQAYRHHKKVLQLLAQTAGRGENPPRWVLKCPIHLFYPKEIAKAYPDAKLIWTHRHPVSAVPSMCSLLKAMHQIYFEKEGRDDSKLGFKVAEVSGNLLTTAPENIRTSGLDCIDVTYNTLINDPLATVKSIYKQYGWEFSKEYETIITDYLAKNKRDREEKAKGKEQLHTYAPEEFGLTEAELSSGKFAEYCAKFNVPMSRN